MSGPRLSTTLRACNGCATSDDSLVAHCRGRCPVLPSEKPCGWTPPLQERTMMAMLTRRVTPSRPLLRQTMPPPPATMAPTGCHHLHEQTTSAGPAWQRRQGQSHQTRTHTWVRGAILATDLERESANASGHRRRIRVAFAQHRAKRSSRSLQHQPVLVTATAGADLRAC